jgi:hypothetical protein
MKKLDAIKVLRQITYATGPLELDIDGRGLLIGGTVDAERGYTRAQLISALKSLLKAVEGDK